MKEELERLQMEWDKLHDEAVELLNHGFYSKRRYREICKKADALFKEIMSIKNEMYGA